MKAAKPTDWKSQALPAKRITIRLNRTYSLQDMDRIRIGLVPESMDDRWFVYWMDNTLFLHRSWTGSCIYVVRFIEADGSYQMVEADVNRDPEQCSETSDEMEPQMISHLVDVLLLRNKTSVSGDEPPKK